MRRARVLLADDHRIVAEGLKGILEPEFELVGIVEDGRALVEAVEKLQPDVVVADISMPLLNGIEAMRQFKKKYKDVAVVFLTMHTDLMYAADAFEAGASGYVSEAFSFIGIGGRCFRRIQGSNVYNASFGREAAGIS